MTKSDEENDLISQAEFARLVNVSPGRISQLKAEGTLPPECFVLCGRRNKIRRTMALAAWESNRDPIQVVANGKPMPLQGDVFATLPNIASGGPRQMSATDELTQERIKAQRLKNEEAEEQRRERAGIYVRAKDVGPVFADSLTQVINGFESELSTLAEQLAGDYGVEVKDVRAKLRKWFRGVREKQSKNFEAMAERLPEHVPDEVEETNDDDNSTAINAASSGNDWG